VSDEWARAPNGSTYNPASVQMLLGFIEVSEALPNMEQYAHWFGLSAETAREGDAAGIGSNATGEFDFAADVESPSSVQQATDLLHSYVLHVTDGSNTSTFRLSFAAFPNSSGTFCWR